MPTENDAGPSLPEIARRLAEAFRSQGYELYLVGGAVRDRLLGQSDTDLDFATSALPDDTYRILTDFGRPYRVGERFGTIGLAGLEGQIEITTYRQEIYPELSRKPAVTFGASLFDDLSRRDFTINALAQDPLSGYLVDPLNGRHDLELGLIRAVGVPEDRFREDPLRLLRAVRFAAALRFDIEPQTWAAMQRNPGDLRRISRERIRDEYTRLLQGAVPSRGLGLLRDSGLLGASVPELQALTQMPDHGPRHPLSLWDHTVRVVDRVDPFLALRWAALLHDVAKPATRTTESNGRPRFFHHEDVGAQIAREVLTSLRYSNAVVDAVSLLIETHMQIHSYSEEWSDGAVRRLRMRLGTLFQESLSLARADAAGHTLTGQSENAPRYDQLEQRARNLERQVLPAVSPLSGDELMQHYNRPPGPWIRHIKEALREDVIDGRLAPDDLEAAWRLADSLMSASEP